MLGPEFLLERYRKIEGRGFHDFRIAHFPSRPIEKEAKMKKLSLPVEGGNISYLTEGQGSNLILLHGLNLSANAWKEVFEPLTRTHTVYALDMLGHGDSTKPSGNFRIEDYAQSVIAFMDKLSLGQAAICGNSVGGLIAAEMAASFPRRVQKLILVGCPARDSWERMERLALSALGFDAQGNPLPISIADLGMTLANPTPELLTWFNQERAKAGIGVKKTLLALSLYDVFPKLPMIKCPTLVLFGEKDILIEKEETLLENIKGARRSVIKRAGHVPQIDQPQAFLEEVNRFLSSP